MAFKTIEVGHYDAGPKVEGLASSTPTPGHLLELTTATADTYKVHATAGGHAMPIFAVEDDLQGAEISTAYTAAARLFARCFRQGDLVFALIANGANVAKGDKLVSNGDGTLKVATPDSSGVLVEEYIVAYAQAGCDMSGSSGEDPSGRCIIRVC